MNIAFKNVAAAGLAALTLAGSVAISSTPAAAYYRHYHGGGGYRHHGGGAGLLVGGIVAGTILGAGAIAAHGEGCWRHDAYGRAYRAC